MAYGNLNVDVVQSSTANTPVQFNDGNGTQVGTLCRAWVQFVGGASPTVTASFNVSSITRVSSGVHTVNFTNALPDTKYAFFAAAGNGNGTNYLMTQNNAFSSSAISFNTYTYAGANSDVTYNNVAIFR